jgi:hypothetical protein
MATNSIIAVKVDEDYKTIYCHNDGYPSYMYPMLRDWYGTQERAEALVSFGDASFVAKRLVPSQGSNHHFNHPEKDVCIFYHRDRGEPRYQVAPCLMSKEEALSCQYYVYIFEDGEWHVYLGGEEAVDYGALE